MTVLGRASLVLDMEGNAEAGLQRLGSALSTMERVAGQSTSSLGGQFRTMATNVGQSTQSLGILAAQQVAGMVSNIGGQIEGFGNSLIGVVTGVGASIIGTAAAFETMETGFRRMYGENASRAITKMEEVATATAFTTREVGGLAMVLKTAGVDALFTEVTSQSGEMINSLEALSDLASTKGTMGMSLLMPALQNFMGGDLKSIQRRMDLPINVMNELKAGLEAVGGATATTQQRFEVLAQVVGTHYGGIGRSLAGTTEFLISNIGDVGELIRKDIGLEALSVFSGEDGLLNQFVLFLREVREVTKNGTELKQVIKDVAAWFANAARAVLEFVKPIVQFVLAHPQLIKIAAVLLLVVGGVLSLAGAALTAAAGIGAVIASMAVMFPLIASAGPVLASIAGMIPAVLVGVAAITAGLIVLFTSMYAAWKVFEVAYNRDFMGIKTLTERVRVTFQGLWEVFSSLFGHGMGRMSRQTFNELQRLGLTDFFIGLSGTVYRTQQFLTGLWDGLVIAGQRMWIALEPIFNDLLNTLFGTGPGSLNQVGAGSLLDRINDISPEQWKSFGKQVGEVVVDVVTGIKDAHQFVTQLYNAFLQVKAVVTSIASVISFMLAPLVMLATIMGRVVSTIAGAPLFQQLMPMLIERGTPQALVQSPDVGSAVSSERVAANSAFMSQKMQTSSGATAGGAGVAEGRPVQLVVNGRVLAEVVAQEGARQTRRLGIGG